MGSVHDAVQRAGTFDPNHHAVNENLENPNFQGADNENHLTYESSAMGHKRQASYLTKGFKISRHERQKTA